MTKNKFTKIPLDWSPKNVSNSVLNSCGAGGIKRVVLRRDNYTCQICLKKWISGRSFDIHHLNREREGLGEISAQEVNELITLCHKCHMSLPHIHAHRRIEKKITKKKRTKKKISKKVKYKIRGLDEILKRLDESLL